MIAEFQVALTAASMASMALSTSESLTGHAHTVAVFTVTAAGGRQFNEGERRLHPPLRSPLFMNVKEASEDAASSKRPLFAPPTQRCRSRSSSPLFPRELLTLAGRRGKSQKPAKRAEREKSTG